METKVPNTCPACGATIRAPNKIIKYETSESERMFAECTGCGEVVQPE